MDYSRSQYISSLWSIQESLLQTYRSIFITLESIFIGISITLQVVNSADVVTGKAAFLLQTIMPPILFVGLYINTAWMKVASTRGLSVHFLQTLLRRCEHPETYKNDVNETTEVFTRLRRFQDDKEYRKEQMSKDDFIGGDYTRGTLGITLPLIFYFYWFVTSLYSILSSLDMIKKGVPIVSIATYITYSVALFSLYCIIYLIKYMIQKPKNPILDPLSFGQK